MALSVADPNIRARELRDMKLPLCIPTDGACDWGLQLNKTPSPQAHKGK